MSVQQAAKTLVSILEKFPEERIKHLVSFKDTQLERFRPVAGVAPEKGDNKAKPTLDEIKDIISRTSGPLGMKTNTVSYSKTDALTEESIQDQIKSLQNLMTNKYRDYYTPGDKLLKPAGNTEYYDRLLAEINGEKRENIFTAFRTVVFGK